MTFFIPYVGKSGKLSNNLSDVTINVGGNGSKWYMVWTLNQYYLNDLELIHDSVPWVANIQSNLPFKIRID